MQRVKFLKKDRDKLFYYYCENKRISLKKLSSILSINYSSLKQYARGDRLTPLNIANKISLLNNINFNSLKVKFYNKNWGASLGGKKGIKILLEKYPEKVLMGRRKAGYKNYIKNFGKRSELKKIKIPKMSEQLAEFIGIYLGDGTLTKYFIRIFGDYRYDKKYFDYITYLVKSLFGLESKISKYKNTIILTVLSQKLCYFLRNTFFLSYGNKIKNQTTIPKCILNNERLLKACIRGLVDTDGCIGRSGDNFKLVFTSYNKSLQNQINKINNKFKFFNRLYGNNFETCSFNKVKHYMAEVGSSNLKHIVRYNEKLKEGKHLYKIEVLDYYPRYKNLKLPYFGPVV